VGRRGKFVIALGVFWELRAGSHILIDRHIVFLIFIFLDSLIGHDADGLTWQALVRASALLLILDRAWTLALIRLQAELRNLICEAGTDEAWDIGRDRGVISLLCQRLL